MFRLKLWFRQKLRLFSGTCFGFGLFLVSAYFGFGLFRLTTTTQGWAKMFLRFCEIEDNKERSLHLLQEKKIFQLIFTETRNPFLAHTWRSDETLSVGDSDNNLWIGKDLFPGLCLSSLCHRWCQFGHCAIYRMPCISRRQSNIQETPLWTCQRTFCSYMYVLSSLYDWPRAKPSKD